MVLEYKAKLSSPEVAYVTQHYYYNESVFAIPERYLDENNLESTLLPNTPIPRVQFQDDDTENVYGVTLYREEEDINPFTPYEYIVDEYINLEIKKFFGYTLDEWLNKTYYEVEILRKKASKMKEEIQKTLSKLSNDEKLDNEDMKESTYNMLNDEQLNMLNGDDI